MEQKSNISVQMEKKQGRHGGYAMIVALFGADNPSGKWSRAPSPSASALPPLTTAN